MDRGGTPLLIARAYGNEMSRSHDHDEGDPEMKSTLFASSRAKVAAIGVIAMGVFTGAAYADALPGPVQSGVAGLAGNVGLPVPSGQGPTLAPLNTTSTDTPAATTTDKNDGQQGQSDSGQQGQSDSGQQGQSDSGQQGQSDSGQQGQSDSGQQGQSDSGQQGQSDSGQQGQRDDGQQGQRDDGQQGQSDSGQHG